MRLLFSGLTAALLVTTIMPAAPAAANPTGMVDHFHTAISTSTTWPERSATVTCPSGQIVWGFGGMTIGGTGQVALTEIMPNAQLTSVTVRGRARNGWLGDFKVQARATCWPAANVALQLFVGSVGAASHAECPGSKVVYSSGFSLSASAGDPYVTKVEPDGDMSGTTVVAGGAATAGLRTVAVALCGFANLPAIYIYDRTQDTVPVSAGPSTTGEAPPIATSPAGWSWVTGAGVSSTASGMFIDAIGPVPALDRGMARMSREAVSLAMTSGEEMTTYGTCIGAWY